MRTPTRCGPAVSSFADFSHRPLMLTLYIVMGYTSDGFPFIGEVPDRPSQYICAGFSGHGMPQAFLSAKAVASMIAEGKTADEVDLPRLYRASRERVNSEKQHISLTSYESAIPEMNKQG